MSLRRSHLLWLLLAGVAALLLFQGRRTLTEHEVFAAEPAREMLAGKGWLLQPFAGEIRTKKPPGQSWLIAASLFGTQSRDEWAARLPSAVAGIGLAVAVAAMTARLGTSRTGLVAGLMTLTCVGVQQRARLAEADMALACCVGVANACVVFALTRPTPDGSRAGRGGAMLFWAAVAFGFLLKGPIVLGFTLLPAAVTWGVLRYRDKRLNTKARSHEEVSGDHGVHGIQPLNEVGAAGVDAVDAATPVLSSLRAFAPSRLDVPPAAAVANVAFWWPALLLGLAVIVAWPVAAAIEHPAAVAQWKHEIFDRVQGQVGHGDERRHDPLVAYAWLLPQSALPWCVFAFPAIAFAWRARGVRWKPTTVAVVSWGACGFVMVSLIAFKVLHYILPAVAPLLMLSAFGFDRVLTRFLRRRPRASRPAYERATLAGWFGLATVAWLLVVVLSHPTDEHSVTRFARAVEANVPAGETVYLFGVGEERSVWYFERTAKQTQTLPDARPAYVICTRADRPTVPNATTLAEAEPFVTRQADADRRVLLRVD